MAAPPWKRPGLSSRRRRPSGELAAGPVPEPGEPVAGRRPPLCFCCVVWVTRGWESEWAVVLWAFNSVRPLFFIGPLLHDQLRPTASSEGPYLNWARRVDLMNFRYIPRVYLVELCLLKK